MMFIKLTRNGEPIYLNVMHIEAITNRVTRTGVQGSNVRTTCSARDAGYLECLHVEESPEEILELIHKTKTAQVT